MTIGAIVLDIAIILVLICALCVGLDSTLGGVIRFLIGFIITIAIVVGQLWYYNNSESGKRAIKTQESNYSGGIKRSVQVYDINGELIKEYKGKFDIDYDDDRIIFDDEKGKRHTIFYTTGTVVVDELDKKSK